MWDFMEIWRGGMDQLIWGQRTRQASVSSIVCFVPHKPVLPRFRVVIMAPVTFLARKRHVPYSWLAAERGTCGNQVVAESVRFPNLVRSIIQPAPSCSIYSIWRGSLAYEDPTRESLASMPPCRELGVFRLANSNLLHVGSDSRDWRTPSVVLDFSTPPAVHAARPRANLLLESNQNGASSF